MSPGRRYPAYIARLFLSRQRGFAPLPVGYTPSSIGLTAPAKASQLQPQWRR